MMMTARARTVTVLTTILKFRPHVFELFMTSPL